jgi:hypothetical protein
VTTLEAESIALAKRIKNEPTRRLNGGAKSLGGGDRPHGRIFVGKLQRLKLQGSKAQAAKLEGLPNLRCEARNVRGLKVRSSKAASFPQSSKRPSFKASKLHERQPQTQQSYSSTHSYA